MNNIHIFSSRKILPLSFVFLFWNCSIKNEILFEPAETHTLINANVAAWHFYEPTVIKRITQNEELLLGVNYRQDYKYAFYQKTDSVTWQLLRYFDLQKDSLFSRIYEQDKLSVENLNQIYITNPIYYPRSLFHINLQNNTRYKYTVQCIDTNLFLQISTEYYSAVPIRNRLYVPLGNWESFDDLEYKFSKPSLVEIEFTEDSVIKSTIFGLQPEIYKKDYYHQVEGSFLATDGKYLYQSFQHDHNIYVYNDHRLMKTVYLPSKHIDKFVPIDTSKNLSDPSYILNYLNANYIYGYFYYDPYRQLFYRILKFPAKNTRTYDFAVMVFDKDLKFLSEQIFDGVKYWSGQFVIAKEGVYIGKKPDIQSPHAYMQLFKPTRLGLWGKLKRAFKVSGIDY